MKTITSSLDKPMARGFWTALGFAALTACLSQATIRLPFSPVPITLQVLGVILSGMLLGSRLGALAQIQYIAAGLMGAPIFAGAVAGPVVLAGPTAGYLPGFILGAFITGLLAERMHNRQITSLFAVGLAGVAAIYICGAAWLSVWLRVSGLEQLGAAWLLGILPFIGVDAVKVTLAAMITTSIDRLKV